MTIGENIKYLRNKQGLTQKELAQKCDCATGTIQQYELGKRQPRLEQLKRIANVLNIYVGELLGDNFEEYKEQIIDDFSETFNNALKKASIAPLKVTYGDPEKSDQLNNYFEILNDSGQKKAIDYVEDLTKIPEYRRDPSAE